MTVKKKILSKGEQKAGQAGFCMLILWFRGKFPVDRSEESSWWTKQSCLPYSRVVKLQKIPAVETHKHVDEFPKLKVLHMWKVKRKHVGS